MKTHTYYYRTIGEGDDSYIAYCDKAAADGTYFQFTDKLEDGQEFGLTFTVTEVLDGPPTYVMDQVDKALAEYRAANA
jgi:hypothetical protein